LQHQLQHRFQHVGSGHVALDSLETPLPTRRIRPRRVG
jgi:hypothetical protein